MTYRLAHSLDRLREQVKKAAPDRSKASDGWIGDAKHQSRSSDHNPWIVIKENGKNMRVVSALDITHDPAGGLDAGHLAEDLLRSRDKRIKYIIYNHKIAAGRDGPNPWQWRKYNGSNPHTKHMHLSVEDSQVLFDDDDDWQFTLTPAHGKPIVEKPLLKKGKKGAAVKELQQLLNKFGHELQIDGDFGPATDRAVRLFQRAHGLHPDGIVGPYTWEKLS